MPLRITYASQRPAVVILNIHGPQQRHAPPYIINQRMSTLPSDVIELFTLEQPAVAGMAQQLRNLAVLLCAHILRRPPPALF